MHKKLSHSVYRMKMQNKSQLIELYSILKQLKKNCRNCRSAGELNKGQNFKVFLFFFNAFFSGEWQNSMARKVNAQVYNFPCV